jgi:hypothetical protein
MPVSSHARYEIHFTRNALSGDFATNRHELCGLTGCGRIIWLREKFDGPPVCVRTGTGRDVRTTGGTSWVTQYLMRETILLRRAIRGLLLRSRPEKMFNVVQGIRLKSFRGLRPCI